MGVDAQLVDDGTYFLVEVGGEPAGCGGWSRRATLYGHGHSPTQDGSLLDPATDPARVRAMYTHPRFTRRGVGRLILGLCEAAAAAEGFSRLELVASLAGEPLYAAAGFVVVERLEDTSGPVPVPIVRMAKPIAPAPARRRKDRAPWSRRASEGRGAPMRSASGGGAAGEERAGCHRHRPRGPARPG